jgi:hypothetical protein
MRRHRVSKRLLLLLAALAVAAAPGCRELTREATTPYPSGWPEAAPWRLDRELLLPGGSERILFLVELSAGRAPDEEALDRLAGLASRYGGRPASWLRLGEEGAPELRWDRKWRLRCPGGPLPPGTSHVLVSYRGELDGFYGMATRARAHRSCGVDSVRLLAIAQETVDRSARLFMTRRRLETRDLLHEYGHLLGLGSNPAHGYYPGYPSLARGPHCVNPDCVLAVARFRAKLYAAYRTGLRGENVEEFCAECRADVKAARALWLRESRAKGKARGASGR